MLILPVAAALVALAASSVTSAAAGKHPARRSYAGTATPPRAHIAGFCCGNPGTADERAEGIFRNLTPYPLTFVNSVAPNFANNWNETNFPTTLNPGDQFTYRLAPYDFYGFAPLGTDKYDGWFTYRADTVTGPEYLSLKLVDNHCGGGITCGAGDRPALSVSADNGSAAPTNSGDFGPKTANPEIVWTSSGPQNTWGTGGNIQNFDYTFEVQGTYNIDASTIPSNQSGALADVLNGACTPQPNGLGATCSFTPTTPLTFSAGTLTPYTVEPNCSVNKPGGEPLPAAERDVTVTQSREATISVGGSASVGVEADVFGVFEAGVSAKFGVEHEWTDDTEFSKTVRIFVPSGWVGEVWVAPEVGKVTGTMAMKTLKVSYTITNLTEVKSGVQPDLLTPPYDLLFNARPMTAAERQQACPPSRRPSPPAPTRGLG